MLRICAGRSGKHFSESGGAPWQEVIGVVQDVRMNGLGDPAPAIAYWPILSDLPSDVDVTRAVTFAVRSSRVGTPEFIGEVQRAVWSVSASLPVAEVRTMEDISEESMARTSFTLVMFSLAGSMALALGLLGIYRWKRQWGLRPQGRKRAVEEDWRDRRIEALEDKIGRLERIVGGQWQDLDFFESALRRVEKRNAMTGSGASASTPRSVPGCDRKAN